MMNANNILLKYILPFSGMLIFLLFFYLPSMDRGLIGFDDGSYIRQIKGSLENNLSLKEVLFSQHANNSFWIPISWLLYYWDVLTFDQQYFYFYFQMLLLHFFNALVVFAVFLKIGKSYWAAMMTAFLFAFHPVNTETVCWIAALKGVLAAFFIWIAFALYVYEKNVNRRFCGTLFFFLMGILSYPVYIMFPFILFLYDLKKIYDRELVFSCRLIFEKFLFILLSAAVGCITYTLHDSSHVVSNQISLWHRILNAGTSCLLYLKNIFYPHALSILYPYHLSENFDFFRLACLGMVVVFSLGVFYYRRRFSSVFLGWFWFLLSLLPTLGLIQAGPQAMADRFIYFPMAGVLFFTYALLSAKRGLLMLFFTLHLSVLFYFLPARLELWKQPERLWKSAIENYPDNPLALNNYGVWLKQNNRVAEALDCFEKSARMQFRFNEAPMNIAQIRLDEGKNDEAEKIFHSIIKDEGESGLASDAHYFLGHIYSAQKNFQKAQYHYLQVKQDSPFYAQVLNNLALIDFQDGLYKEAKARLLKAVRLEPGKKEYLFNLSQLYYDLNEKGEALRVLEKLVRLYPEDQDIVQNREYVRSLIRSKG